MLKEKVTALRAFRTFLLNAGLAIVALTSLEGSGESTHSVIGDMLFFLAGLCWVGFTLSLKKWAIQGLGADVFAFLAYGKSVQKIGATRAALFPAIVPVCAMLIGVSVTGEIAGIPEITGALLTSQGLAIALGALGPLFAARRKSSGSLARQRARHSPKVPFATRSANGFVRQLRLG